MSTTKYWAVVELDTSELILTPTGCMYPCFDKGEAERTAKEWNRLRTDDDDPGYRAEGVTKEEWVEAYQEILDAASAYEGSGGHQGYLTEPERLARLAAKCAA